MVKTERIFIVLQPNLTSSRFRFRHLTGTVVLRLLLEWILQNMVRDFVTHKQVQADKRLPI